jgi:hypothetical protein
MGDMDVETVSRVRDLISGSCLAAHSSDGQRSGVLFVSFDGVELTVMCEWSLRVATSAVGLDADITSIVGAHVRKVLVDPTIHDLSITFEGPVELQAIPDSDEFESWQLVTPSGEMIGVGPGSSWWRFGPRD